MAKSAGIRIKTDALNIILMVISLVLAFNFPFELFILAYAILGPLHYLTEVNWLEKKSYFVKQKKWVWLLVLISAVVAIPIILVKLSYTASYFPEDSWMNGLRMYAVSLAFAALITAIALTLTKKWWIILLTLFTSFVIGELLIEYRFYTILVGVLLPSLFHVFVFTLLFMLYGAMKGKSRMGYLSVVLLTCIPLFIFIMPLDVASFEVSAYFKHAFDISTFSNLNYGVGWLIGAMENGELYSMMSVAGLKIQIFIAFAYTYHYLNWFSKTTVIGWHKVISSKKMILIIVIWLASVVIYLYNYFAGFLILLFLSYLHVLLEFPLNVVSVREIVKGIFGKRSVQE